VLRPRLVRERQLVHRLVDDPALLTGHLQHEHVVHVVVRIETARGRGCHVGVHLRGMPQLAHERTREGHERRPRAVQALQHDRRSGRELGQDLRGVDLVGDFRAVAAGRGEPACGQHVALLRHAQEGRAQGALGQQFVDRVG
jgi:hypothetical protein